MSVFARLLKNRPILLSSAAAVAIVSASVTLHQVEFATAAQTVAENPAVPVSVQTLDPEDVRVWSEFSGRMNAVDYAELRPEVNGRITEIRFKDGQTVKAGDILFVIDPRPYEAALAKANADLVSARANASLASSQLARAASLVKTQFVSRSTFDQRVSARDVAVANVRVAEATQKQAEIDIDHAYVKAPIAGRVSRPEITLGNLVQTGPGAPLLTSIISNDGIYADFEVDEQTYIKSIHANAGTHDQERQIPVELKVEGDGGHVYKGTVYSFDNRIDAGSGTIRARARFANEDGSLVPGMFVSVRLASSVSHNALLVPERAIGTDQSKRFVYVVEDGGKAVSREVHLGNTVDGGRIVLSGLHAGERVIVDGLQHVTPGATVHIQNTVADVSRLSRQTVDLD
ncbi:MAG: efflux RND transporter periplasmic adaptor subunit [Parvibaculum sp.]|nr:efflux RND transporter periplasmic adaptor subunit [Parvibaculum sp.]